MPGRHHDDRDTDGSCADRGKQERALQVTHASLIRLAERWLRNEVGCGVVLCEFRCANESGEQPDVLGLRSEASFVVEVKVSRSDFLRDHRKPFRDAGGGGLGDWRIYLAPAGLIGAHEMPKGWCLLETDGSAIVRSIGLPQGNCAWGSAPFVGDKRSERQVLYSALRRVQRTAAGRRFCT
jgi:hypothetical protein